VSDRSPASGDTPLEQGTRPATSLVSSVTSQTAAIIPAFLVGSLAVQMGDELGFSEGSLGAAVAFFFLLAAITSPHAGTLADRLGPQRSLRTANLLSGLTVILIATLVYSYWVLLLFLGIGAIGLTIAGPGTKTMVARGVPIHRHGLAFGIQASAVPLAVFLAGLAVPFIGVTVGWRWAFAAAVVVPITGFVAAPAYHPASTRAVRVGGKSRGLSEIDYGPLNMLGLAAALGSAAATTMAAFFVSAATEAGIDEATAGYLLAVASGAVIAMRILMGYIADRRETGHLHIVTVLLAVSTVGYLAAASGSKVLLPLGAVFALGAGWAWSGLIVHTVVRAYSDAPGAATGMTSGGLNVGGVLGPLVFGQLVEHVSYRVGFTAIAVSAFLGAIAADQGRRRLKRLVAA
jgi:predicted MFS family arabinose efflux permease